MKRRACLKPEHAFHQEVSCCNYNNSPIWQAGEKLQMRAKSWKTFVFICTEKFCVSLLNTPVDVFVTFRESHTRLSVSLTGFFFYRAQCCNSSLLRCDNGNWRLAEIIMEIWGKMYQIRAGGGGSARWCDAQLSWSITMFRWFADDDGSIDYCLQCWPIARKFFGARVVAVIKQTLSTYKVGWAPRNIEFLMVFASSSGD